MPETNPQSPVAQQHAASDGWMNTLAALPAVILQPFSLSAVAVVGAILLGVFGSVWGSIVALLAAVALLAIGLRGTPREAIGSLVGSATYQQVSHLSVATPVDRTGITHARGGQLNPLEAICFLHLYQRDGGSVGVYGRVFPMDYFVDLLSAALVPSHLEVLTHEMVEHLKGSGRLEGVTTAATPKRGNVLLTAAAAREAGLETVFIKQRPLFGKMVEGLGGRPKKAVLMDDISSDGELLSTSVRDLRDSGYEVTDAFVLIDRPECDAHDELAKIGVRLWPLRSFSDNELESIAARGRRGEQG